MTLIEKLREGKEDKILRFLGYNEKQEQTNTHFMMGVLFS